MQNVQRRDRVRDQVRLQQREPARLAQIARHSTMKALLAQTARDLDEAIACLDVAETRTAQAEAQCLQGIESMVLLAHWRLEVAGRTLTTRGPNAMLIQLT